MGRACSEPHPVGDPVPLKPPRTSFAHPAGARVVIEFDRLHQAVGRVIFTTGTVLRVEDFTGSQWTVDAEDVTPVSPALPSQERRYRVAILKAETERLDRMLKREIEESEALPAPPLHYANFLRDKGMVQYTTPLGERCWKNRHAPTEQTRRHWDTLAAKRDSAAREAERLSTRVELPKAGQLVPSRSEAENWRLLADDDLLDVEERAIVMLLVGFWRAHPDDDVAVMGRDGVPRARATRKRLPTAQKTEIRRRRHDDVQGADSGS
jgi:hypothetical protein